MPFKEKSRGGKITKEKESKAAQRSSLNCKRKVEKNEKIKRKQKKAAFLQLVRLYGSLIAARYVLEGRAREEGNTPNDSCRVQRKEWEVRQR
ncbi:hypothetical protein WR25_11929 [Diploscapter pachys]|uniref:Uncharacterized protein n=1 Tax=Diploscapter pachys TaxID=2018661 RepID=A0A2A2LTD1_9BILA|nr:hypothetical protein WR25_11929 [Diploscapter pachys]